MTFSVRSDAEAYASVCLLVVGADGVGTLEERNFLFADLGDAEVFDDYDAEALGALMADLVTRIYAEGSAGDVEAGAVGTVCRAVGELLDSHHRHELFSLAVRVAHSDGLVPREHAVLTEISGHLGVKPAVAEAMIEGGFD